MKANVQYNDFKGTSAADISDHVKLSDFLKERGVDTERYEAIGSSFYSSYDDFDASIICKDNEQSTPENLHLVKISFETGIEMDEYFNLFKRYEVISVPEFYNKFEIKEEVMIDDREEESDENE